MATAEQPPPQPPPGHPPGPHKGWTANAHLAAQVGLQAPPMAEYVVQLSIVGCTVPIVMRLIKVLMPLGEVLEANV